MAAILVMHLAAAAITRGQGAIGDDHAITDTSENLLNLLNAERIGRGLSAVSSDEVLQRAAQWMADDMARRGTLSHTDSRHRDLTARLHEFGYDRPRLIAEKMAEGRRRLP
jgi:uncharacterized protein YkwD